MNEPASFDTWTDNGLIYHNIGLMQLWQRQYTDGDSWSDPPILKIEFTDWLAANNCQWMDWGAFGPPAVCFPDGDTADRFRQEWHEPGEQKFIEYLDSDQAKELDRHNREVLGLNPDEDA